MSDLISTIKSGPLQDVQNLIWRDPAAVHQVDENGAGTIATALYYGKPEIVRLLILAGAPISFQLACALGDLDLAERLFTADPALLNAFSADGYPALGLAAFFGRLEIAEWLISLGADVNLASTNNMRVAPLHAAVASQNVAIARLLLAHGADVNQPQQDAYTPLHAAAANGQVEMVEMLLGAGADRSARLANGQTPADLAADAGHTAVTALLA
jgi:ankyrin repeat protein